MRGRGLRQPDSERTALRRSGSGAFQQAHNPELPGPLTPRAGRRGRFMHIHARKLPHRISKSTPWKYAPAAKSRRHGARSATSTDNLVTGEELANLYCRSIGGIGPMYRILAD